MNDAREILAFVRSGPVTCVEELRATAKTLVNITVAAWDLESVAGKFLCSSLSPTTHVFTST